MDTQGKLTVDFKPTKRMKKRRELDALLNGKQQSQPETCSKSGKLKNGKHELLQNDSEFSEVEEYNFNMAAKGILHKNEFAQMCSTCRNLCWGFLFVCCFVSIGGLVWTCVQLKKDVDQLQNRLNRVELTNMNIPGQIHGFNIVHEDFVRQLELLKNSGDGVLGIHGNLTHLTNQVSALESSLRSVNSNAVNSPQLLVLLSLPQQLRELSMKVAEMGSNLRTLDQTIRQLATSRTHLEQQITDLDARLQSLQLDNRKIPVESTPTSPDIAEDKAADRQPSGVEEEMELLFRIFRSLNATVYKQIKELDGHSKSSDLSISEFNNYTRLLNTRVSFIEMKPARPSTADELNRIVADVVQNKFELFRNASSREQEKANEKIEKYFENHVIQLRLQNATIAVLSVRLNDLTIRLSQLRNSTDADIMVLNATSEDLLARMKELKSIVISDNDVSRETTQNESQQLLASSSSEKRVETAADSKLTTKQYSLQTRRIDD